MTPEQVLSISIFAVGCLAALTWFLAREPRGQVRHRADGDPLAGARPAAVQRPGVVPLAPMASIEPALTPSALPRPFVVLRPPSSGDLTSVPSPLPAAVAMRGHAVLVTHRCRLCHDGAEVIGPTCILCGCASRAVTR
jgi:hypothetical protein